MATPEIETARELATHANDIEHLQKDMDKLVQDMEEIKKAIQSIQTTLSEAKGGWRLLAAAAGAGGVLTIIAESVIKLWSK
jgi:prefoldin subunit 5